MKVSQRYSAKSQNRNSDALRDSAESINANRQAVFELGNIFKHRSEHDEVRAAALGLQCLFKGMSRSSNDHFRSKHSSNYLCRQRPRCEVNAGAGTLRDVGAIIDKDARASPSGGSDGGFGDAEYVTSRKVPFTNLEQIYSGSQGSLYEISQDGRRRGVVVVVWRTRQRLPIRYRVHQGLRRIQW